MISFRQLSEVCAGWAVYAFATLDYIGNLFPRQKQLGRNCTKMPFKIRSQRSTNSGHVNKQNCRIWGSENPHEVLEKPMHPLRVTVLCGLWSGGGATVTVGIGTMLTDFFVPARDGIDVNNVWFQQDGATCHTSHATIDILHETFDGRLIR